LKFRHRKRQLQELHLMVKNVEKPVVVAGDFNVFRGDREFQVFAMESRFKTANNESHPYHSSRSPHRQLDYIFHSPGIQVTFRGFVFFISLIYIKKLELIQVVRLARHLVFGK